MTDFQRFRERTRDMQDGIERHVYSEQEFIDNAGSIIKVKGTGTLDEEAAVLNIGGVSFNLPKDTNTEVMLLAGGSDTNLKFAILTIPRDKQRKWAEGSGGIQHPTDGDRCIEFNGDETWLKEGTFKIGHDKTITLTVGKDGSTLKTNSLTLDLDSQTINGDLKVNGNVTIQGDFAASGGDFTHNGTDVGSDHKHSGIEKGGSDTGPPV